ncbi:MAG TPA: hypothetical protein VL098_14490 [Flavipsychrobacter sp.]|nr:hypothetical protein [Flavipsychrobacter sp.]
MSTTGKNMFELLPAIYRIRDTETGSQLKAFFDILEREANVTENNITQLYKNWFIETCEEWVVPYIGDLLGVRGLHTINNSSAVSQRAYVANTLSYRRRKGIAPVLEQLALDVSGWRAHAVEFFDLLATTQFMNHIRLHRTVTPDMRKMNQLDLTNTPFDTLAHTADMRHISSGRGKYNIPNLGVFVWRLQSYPVIYSEARKVNCEAPSTDHYYTFDPTGTNQQLFNRPQTESAITNLSTEINLPAALRRRALFDELEARRHAIVNNEPIRYEYFDNRPVTEGDVTSNRRSILEVFANNSVIPVPPEEMLICNLEKCCTPEKNRTYKRLKNDGTYEDVTLPITVSVDPVCGRFVFSDTAAITMARVSYSYGFSGDTAAGVYNRQTSLTAMLQTENLWHAGVSKTITAIQGESIFTTLKDAVNTWNNRPDGETGLITIMDSASYFEDIDILIKRKSKLLIVAANWLEKPDNEDPNVLKRYPGDIACDSLRPHICGKVTVKGKVEKQANVADFESREGGELELNGLWIEGKLAVLKGNLGALKINHTTISPTAGTLDIGIGVPDAVSNQWLQLEIQRAIVGAINVKNTPLSGITIIESIVDNAKNYALQAEKTDVKISNATFFGKVLVKSLEAENSIFNDLLQVIRRQAGCIRFSFVSQASETPRKFRCQPELEINLAIAKEEEENGTVTATEREAIRKLVSGRLVPVFTSQHFGHHAYAQLSYTCPEQIANGADNGSEMGAFCYLQQPQRTANIRIALDEYLPLGLESGVFFVT